MGSSDLNSFAERVEAIEEAYEFLLAYAAQGHSGEKDGPADQIRYYLERVVRALEGIGDAFSESLGAAPQEVRAASIDFRQLLEDDARKTISAVSYVLAMPAISSQMIDNLNASIHFRALLTDLFIADS